MRSSPFIWPALFIAAILFYAPLLFQSDTTIHWDLAGQSYPAQKFFAEHWRSSGVPLGTRNLISGVPFVGDPSTGAFYPLHWPFFAVGVTPKSLAWELALHAAIALTGAYALAGMGQAAVGTALCYGFGGFFAAHSSHLALFECAAWLPWILFAAKRARYSVVACLLGLALLAGSVTGSVAVFAALLISGKPSLRLSLGVAAGVLLGGLVWLPWLHYGMSHVPFERLAIGDFATLFTADYYGLSSGIYTGPGDLRSHYFYESLLLVPLAIAGAVQTKPKSVGVLIALGVALSFWSTEAWFVAALGLALLVTPGIDWAAEQSKKPRLWMIVLVFLAADLWHWNLYKTPLVMAHVPFVKLPKVQEPYPGLTATDRESIENDRNALRTGAIVSSAGAAGTVLLLLF